MSGERRVLIMWAVARDSQRAVYFHEFEEHSEAEANYVEIVRQMSAATQQHLRLGEHIEVEDAPWSPTEYLQATNWAVLHDPRSDTKRD